MGLGRWPPFVVTVFLIVAWVGFVRECFVRAPATGARWRYAGYALGACVVVVLVVGFIYKVAVALDPEAFYRT